MTKIEKEKVRYWRGEGLGYKTVAAKAGVTENAVKSFCKRNGLTGEPVSDTACRQCGKPLEGASPFTPTPRKKFCGDACRSQWWNAHAYLREPNSQNRRTCIHCGAEFFSDPCKNRKYCGHPCYVAHRFQGGNAQ